MAHNIFRDVWNLEPHPQYNHLLVQLNLISKDRERLPSTRTSKNGLREGDGKLEKLYEWVRKKYDKPSKDDDIKIEDQDEMGLFENLEAQKTSHLKGAVVTTVIGK